MSKNEVSKDEVSRDEVSQHEVSSPAAGPDHARTAFVLGGGGALGASQVGALRALVERDIRPDVVLGTSIGAINGAYYAADPSLDGLGALESLWTRLTSIRGLRENSGYLRRPRAADLRTHVYPTGGLLQLLRDELPAGRFEQLELPFQCVAASVEHAMAHWFDSGELAGPVVASCSVPGLFPPFRIADEHYLDGGLVHSIPVGRALTLGCTRIYVLHVGRVEQPLRPPRWPWEVGQVAFEIARRHRYQEELATVPQSVELVVLPTGAQRSPAISLGQLGRGSISRRIGDAYAAACHRLDQESR